MQGCPVSSVGRTQAFYQCISGLIPSVSMKDGFSCYVDSVVSPRSLKHIQLSSFLTTYFYHRPNVKTVQAVYCVCHYASTMCLQAHQTMFRKEKRKKSFAEDFVFIKLF